MNTNRELSKKEKILSCIGKLTQKSTANLCEVCQSYVNTIWTDVGYNYKEERYTRKRWF